MWKKFQVAEDYLRLRSDDPSFKRWAHKINQDSAKKILLRGFAHDGGVAANFGRSGASGGPEHFRKSFYRMPANVDVGIIDVGDFVTDSGTIEESHDLARKTLPQNQNSLTVSVGGGHDWAAVDFDVTDIQIIHVDTHLDVRPFDKNRIHSGMPFRYLAEKGAKIWSFGAQQEYHMQSQWEFAMSEFEGLCSLDETEKDFAAHFERCLANIKPDHPVGLSIDLDAFPQATSPGVSAPNPRGICVERVIEIIDAIAINLNIVGFYELNPKYDRDDQSARLASYLLARIMMKKFS